MYSGVAIFLIVSAIFLAVISRKNSGREAGNRNLRRFPEVLYSPEAAQRNAIRIITICVVLGFVGGGIMRFSMVQQDFTGENGLYKKLELGEEEIAIILKNQKIVGSMWLSALIVCLAAGASLRGREHIHPRQVVSVLVLIPGFVIGLFIMAISPDVLPEKAGRAAVESVCQHYFLIGVAVMIAALLCSWFCWRSGERQLKHHWKVQS
jgi:hypothetical protein